MPYAILHPTATAEASTPLAPLIPQNQGVGFLSTADMKRMPVGKPYPMSNPAGRMTATATRPRSTKELLSSESSKGGTQKLRGSASVAIAHNVNLAA